MLIRLWKRHLSPFTVSLAVLVGLQLASTLAALYIPSLNGQIIDDGVAKGNVEVILHTGAVMLGVSLIQVVMTITATWVASRASSGLGAGLRQAVFDKVASFSHQEVAQFGAPTLISRATNDTDQIQTMTNLGLAMLVPVPMMMIGGVLMALREDVVLSWIVAVVIPLLGVSIGFLVTRMIPSFERMQKEVDNVNRIFREQITGVRVVRAFTTETVEEDRFAVANTDYTAAAVRVGHLFSFVFPIAMMVANASLIGVVWFGADRIHTGQMTIGSMTAFMQYMLMILMSVMIGTMMTMMVPRANISARRLGEVFDTETSVTEPAEPCPIPDGPVDVTFDHVSFAYPGADQALLCDVTFTAEPGTTTAIIGSTGAGKTTAINLIPRLFDATSGSVAVGSVPVTDAASEDLWARIGLVPQRAYLFLGTVRSNLAYGDADATDDDMWTALRIAQAAEFVEEFDEGLDAPISQGGTNVSGGQRQRLAIARAVMKRPSVYLFDDAFSALDTATDAALQTALKPITKDATVIVVAQRVSSIHDADQIIVVDDGRIVGQGTHRELLASCSTYQEIVESQTGHGDLDLTRPHAPPGTGRLDDTTEGGERA